MADPRYALVMDGKVHQLDVPAEWLDIPNLQIIDVSAAAGVAEGWIVASDGTVSAPPTPVIPPQTIFTPREVIQTLFTPAEQEALYKAAQTPDGWQVSMFISLVTATPSIDITNAEFVADIGVVEAAGLLTAPRAAQILARTPAPTS